MNHHDAVPLREMLTSACAAPGPQLWECPRATPLPAQQHIVDRAILVARAELRLPVFGMIRWVDAPPGRGYPRGTTVRHSTGSIDVWLDVAQAPDDLRRVVFHELQHVADLHARLQLDPVLAEARAIEFAARAMGWR